METQEERRRYGRFLRKTREALAMDRDQFALAIGVSSTTVKQVELGYQSLGKTAKLNVEKMAKNGASEGRAMLSSRLADARMSEIVERVVRMACSEEFRDKALHVAKTTGQTCSEALEMLIRWELGKDEESDVDSD